MSEPKESIPGVLTDPRWGGPHSITTLHEGPVPPSGLGGPGRGEEEEVRAVRSILSLEDLLRYLQRYWKWSLRVAGPVALLILLSLVGSLPEYTSQTHMEVEMMGETDRLFERTVMPENFPQYLVNTQKVGLQTRAYQEYFYNTLDGKVREDFLHNRGFRKPVLTSAIAGLRGAAGGMKRGLLSLLGLSKPEDLSPEGTRESFLLKLNEDALNISEVKESHLIRVSVHGPNRDLVAKLANLYAQTYVDYLQHRERETAREKYELLKKREEETREMALASRRELNRYRVENELMDTAETDGARRNNEIQHLYDERAKIRVDYTTAESVLSQVKRAKEEGRTLFGIREIAQVASVQELYRNLVQLQQQYQSAKALYGDRHVSVRQGLEQVRALEDLMAQEMDRVVGQYQTTFTSAAERLDGLERELEKVLKYFGEHERQASELAALLARADSDQQTYDAILKKLNEAKLETEIPSTIKVKVVNIATPAAEPFKPNKPLSVVLSGMVFCGLFLGIPLALGAGEDLSRRYSIRIPWVHRNLPSEIGAIPQVRKVGNLTMLAEAFRRGPARESLFKLASFIERRADERHSVFLLTSAIPGEGKSFLAAALGGVFGSQGKKTLLIDCNLRNPSSREWFPISDTSTNLTEWLEDSGAPGEVHYQRFGHSDLYILGADGWTLNPGGLLRKQRFRQLLKRAQKEFEVVILDGPTAEEAVESSALVEAATQILLVSDRQLSTYGEMAEANRALKAVAGETEVGVVANRA